LKPARPAGKKPDSVSGHREICTGNALRVFVWNAAGTSGYIDDFSFERTPAVKRNIAPEMLLSIQVDSSAMAKLGEKRKVALSGGILEAMMKIM